MEELCLGWLHGGAVAPSSATLEGHLAAAHDSIGAGLGETGKVQDQVPVPIPLPPAECACFLLARVCVWIKGHTCHRQVKKKSQSE